MRQANAAVALPTSQPARGSGQGAEQPMQHRIHRWQLLETFAGDASMVGFFELYSMRTHARRLDHLRRYFDPVALSE
jgi:hypothetical protein